MAIKYNWVIGQVETEPENGTITKVDYTVFASDGERNSEISGSANCDKQNHGECKPLQEITLEDIINMVQESVGKDSIETSLASDIESQPSTNLTSNIPWRFSEPPLLQSENK
jgi:hypothetical protein